MDSTNQTDHLVMDLEGNTNTVSDTDQNSTTDTTPQSSTEDNKQEKPLSKKEERELKLAYARALQQRKEVIRRNKELIADKELEVAYWKAEADLLRYRYEKMDFFLKNLEIEPKYLIAKEQLEAKQAEQVASQQPILS